MCGGVLPWQSPLPPRTSDAASPGPGRQSARCWPLGSSSSPCPPAADAADASRRTGGKFAIPGYPGLGNRHASSGWGASWKKSRKCNKHLQVWHGPKCYRAGFSVSPQDINSEYAVTTPKTSYSVFIMKTAAETLLTHCRALGLVESGPSYRDHALLLHATWGVM